MKRYGVICDKVVDLGVQPGKNSRVGGDKSGLVAVAASEVLRGDDADGIASIGLDKEYLAVVVGKICALDNLGDERPKFERLVCGLMVENKIYARHFVCLANEEQSPQKLLGDRERGLPHLRHTDLRQNPFEDVGYLYGITQIRLERLCCKRFEDLVDVGCAFHFADFLRPAERLREGVALWSVIPGFEKVIS